jgi:hypothetical protein
LLTARILDDEVNSYMIGAHDSWASKELQRVSPYQNTVLYKVLELWNWGSVLQSSIVCVLSGTEQIDVAEASYTRVP